MINSNVIQEDKWNLQHLELPKSMSSIAAFAPSTKMCFPSWRFWCKNETDSITRGLITSAYFLYLSSSFSLLTSNDLNLAIWQSARLENLRWKKVNHYQLNRNKMCAIFRIFVFILNVFLSSYFCVNCSKSPIRSDIRNPFRFALDE